MCFKSQYLLHCFWFSASKWHFPSPYCQSEGARVFSILCQLCLGPLWLNTNRLRCFVFFFGVFSAGANRKSPILIISLFLYINNLHCPSLKKVHHDHRVNRALLWHFKQKKKKKKWKSLKWIYFAVAGVWGCSSAQEIWHSGDSW